MKNIVWMRIGMAAVIATALAATFAPQAAANSKCKAIHAVMTEQRVTVGCKPEHTSCFIGEVAGNHGMRGTTYFKSDGIGSRPTTSPDFLPYSGPFEYVLDNGTITTRETGVTNSTQGNPDSGAVTAFQKIVSATGELEGTTGYFFVSGFSRDGRVETAVTGEVCFPE